MQTTFGERIFLVLDADQMWGIKKESWRCAGGHGKQRSSRNLYDLRRCYEVDERVQQSRSIFEDDFSEYSLLSFDPYL